MKEQLRGFSKIFSFTFSQHVKNKGYKNSTIVIALLCLLIPAIIMVGIEMKSSGETEAEPSKEEAVQREYAADLTFVKEIIAVDLSKEKEADLSQLPAVAKEAMNLDITVSDYGDDFEKARNDSKGTGDTLLIVTEQHGREYTMSIVIPEDSGLSEDVAYGFDNLLMAYADGLSVASGGSANYYDVDGGQSGEDDSMSGMDSMAMMIMSYLNVMVLYFFVLIYGQGVANSVVMEKSSKLMENFLVSVKPTAIVLGKLAAITATGILQLFSWIFSLAISFAVGTFAVKSINPETDMFIIQLFSFLKEVTSGMFSPVNCIMAMLVVMSGMLLYCALAAIGGAMASKAEDLSSANVIFTLVLVVSFFVAIYGGGLDGEAKPWLDWIPFTSVMITPSKILMGALPLWKTIASFAVTLATTLAATLAAGKIYKSLALYRGEILKPSTLIKMLRG